jgi:hypothetical protein
LQGTIFSQAEALVENLDPNFRGNLLSLRALKRGWAHLGGENTPAKPIPWPQDYVQGHGSNRQLYYEDLTLFQWVQGYACIMEQEQNMGFLKSMSNQLKCVFEEAQYYCWESAKFGHGVCMSEIEDGCFEWKDTQRLNQRLGKAEV